MSAEPGRKTPYSTDIATRVVWMRLGLSFRGIAFRLQIGLGTTYRIYKRFVCTGELSARKRSSRPQCRKLDEYHELYIIGILMENPSLYLSEIICQMVYTATGIKISGPTVCRIVRKNGYTRKKIRRIARQ